jgi:hypothetical protein
LRARAVWQASHRMMPRFHLAARIKCRIEFSEATGHTFKAEAMSVTTTTYRRRQRHAGRDCGHSGASPTILIAP